MWRAWIRFRVWPFGWVVLLWAAVGPGRAHGADAPNYETDIAPLFTKYCGGCHTEGEANAELSMDDWTSVMRGSQSGAVVTPGSAESSRLVQVLLGTVEPKMPPEDEVGPTAEEIRLIREWIDAGARGPDGNEPEFTLPRVPTIPKSRRDEPVTALAMSRDGQYVAAGSHQSVQLIRVADRSVVRAWNELPGKVEAVSFSPDGTWVIAGTGIAGLAGGAVVWNVADGTEVFRTSGHRDTVYAAVVNHDRTRLATSSYDRKILIWDTASPASPLLEIAEHNGPVFDLAFSPDGENLVSASDDATIKIWRVRDGQRMDTRSEPLREQYTTAMHPNGQVFVGGGEDNRIRVWQLTSRTEPAINPILHARFAHEEAILVLRYSEDGKYLLSLGKDRLAKLWDTVDYQQLHAWPAEHGHILSAAISSAAGVVVLGGSDGQLMWHEVPSQSDGNATTGTSSGATALVPDITASGEAGSYTEAEPNDTADAAQRVELPANVEGVISARGPEQEPDVDLVSFASKQGQVWVLEIRAARDNSPLDSRIEVLSEEGQRIERIQLQAVRDSYFNFRGLDSFQTGDFRLHNWEEMRLNQLLYCHGEVVKFYHYPRGPDSGFNVYPNFGQRHGMFDTTPTAHAFQEPCYVVEPLPPGAPPVPNGLPVFTLYYENDDDAERELGKDSRLTFTAPYDGNFVARISDVRGQGGDEYRYRLAMRAPHPDFQPRLIEGKDPVVGPGRGRKFVVEIDRVDGFDGPVQLAIEGLPDGLYSASPLTIEPGHLRAWGTIWADPASGKPASLESEIRIVASAEIAGQRVQKEPISLGHVQWEDAAKLRAELSPDDVREGTTAGAPITKDGLPVIEVVPGTTTTARVRVERNGEQGPVSFGKEDAAVNAPHGVYVSNIGLNGVLIPGDEQERTVFLATEPWVEPGERVMFLQAEQAGNATTNPVWLRVLEPETAARE